MSKTYSKTALIALAVVLFFGFSQNGLAHGEVGIIISDLGITDAGTLPSSKTYFLKEWSRGFERFFTFNPVKKAELELRITNEKAAEALKIQETKPDDFKSLAGALENYTKAGERLRAQFERIKETSENKNIKKLLEKLDAQISLHTELLNDITEKWNDDPYAESSDRKQIIGDPDFDLLTKTINNAHEKIQGIVTAASEKDKNIEEKAATQITKAEAAVKKLELELARTGPIRLDPTPARISTNTTIERQTPKRDFGDRMKAGLETAGGMLANGKSKLDRAKEVFKEGKFGEAFGNAQSAEVIAKSGLRFIETILRPDFGGLEDGNKIVQPPLPKSTGMPVVPNNASR